MRCDVCGEEAAKLRLVSRSYGSGDDLFVIESVPMVSCPSCGESYLTAETLHEIDRLKLNRHSLSEEKQVKVVNFSVRPSEAA